jgi:ATP-dependent Clp protease ATP-binding subunit ClpA
MTQKSWKIPESGLKAVLNSNCRDLTMEEQPMAPQDLNEAALQALRSLANTKQSSVCFVGGPGTGKVTLMEYVGQYINRGVDVPDTLKNARVLKVELTSMIRAASGRFEERLKVLADGLAEREGMVDGRKIILAFEDLPDLVKVAGRDASLFVKPFLCAKGITVLATAAPEAYRASIGSDPSLDRRFSMIDMNLDARSRTNGNTLADAFHEGSDKPVRIMKPLPLNRPKMTP